MAYDLADLVPLTINIQDAAGNLADAGAVVLTVSLPDDTVATLTPAHPSVGVYQYDYNPSMAGRHVARWVATGLNSSSFVDTFDVRPAQPEYLVSLADAKSYLNIPSSTSDEELRGFIEAATGIVEDVVGPVIVRPVAEVHTRPSQVLVLRQPPIVSLTSIVPLLSGGLGYAASALDFDPDSGIVRRLDGTPIAARNAGGSPLPLRAAYVAGRPVVPAVITLATREVIDHLWETQRGHTQGIRPHPGSGRTAAKKGPTPTLPPRVMELLRPYRRAPALF